MSEQGTVAAVTVRTAGSELAAAAATGATTLQVVLGVDFPETGGQLVVDGDVLTHLGVVEATDPDGADVVTLAAATTRAYAASEVVQVWPLTPQKAALVTLAEQDDAVEARVPHALDALMAEGLRDGPTAETVTISVSGGEWVVDDILGKAPQIDAGALDPGTVPPGLVTDGQPPATSPLPELNAFGVKALVARWDPIANADPVTYRVFLHTAAAVPADDAHQVAETQDRAVLISALADGTPLAYDQEYWISVQAFDPDEAADPSPGVGPARPRRASNDDISAEFVYAGSLEAIIAQIGQLSVLSDNLGAVTIAQGGSLDVGERIRIGQQEDEAVEDAIVIYARELGPNGQRVPLVTLSPDGSTFRGRVVADDVSILNGLELMGTLSKIKPGAGVTMENSVNDPQVAPTVVNALRRVEWPAVGAGYTIRALHWEPSTNRWYRLLWLASSRRAFVDQVDANGAYVNGSSVELGGGSYPHLKVSGLVRLGNALYIYSRWVQDGAAETRIIRYNLTGTLLARSTGGVYDSTIDPVLGLDDSGRIYSFGHYSNTVEEVDPTFANTSFPYLDVGHSQYLRDSDGAQVGPTSADGSQPSWLQIGTFDLGSRHVVVHWPQITRAFAIGSTDDDLSIENPALSWSHEHRVPFGWRSDVICFQQTSATTADAWQFSSYYPTAGANGRYYVGYTLSDGTSETARSPLSSVVVGKRYYPAFGAKIDLPSGVTVGRIYGALASTTVRRRVETITAANGAPILIGYATRINAADESSQPLPPATNEFSSGNPGWMASQVGGILLRGDGRAHLPKLLQAGTVAVPALAANASTNVEVTFPVPFLEVPSCVALAVGTLSTKVVVASRTTTKVTYGVRNETGGALGATSLDWQAIGKTSS